MSNPNARRLATPRGQMTRGANSGPAIMLMPPHVRATFMPNPPLKPVPVPKLRRRHAFTGVAAYLRHLETGPPPPRACQPTPKELKERRRHLRLEQHRNEVLEPLIEAFRKQQRQCGGEFQGMNCYNTLFVGRLAYEVTERKLLREMEAFGPVKDLRIVGDSKGRSKYAFVEYEHEEDMKRAYRAADGMKLEGREVVADVERGHTVPTWLPRRLGGGLGGTRLGGKNDNVTRPGRYDPSRPEPLHAPVAPSGLGRGMMMPGMGHHPPPPLPGPPMDYGYPPMNAPPPPPYGGGSRGGDYYGHGGGGGPPSRREWDRDYGGDRGGGDRGGGDWSRGSGSKRSRSPSPERRHSSSRRRSSRR